MIRIWHDSAMRWMPLWLTITSLNTSVLLGFLLWRQVTRAETLQPPTGKLLAVLWLAVVFYFVFGSVRTRCAQMEMTLPIPSRPLWRRHLAAILVAGGLVLAGSLAVLMGHAALIARVGRQPILEIPYGALIAPLLGGLLLAASVTSSVEPGLWMLTGKRSYWLVVLGTLAAIPILLVGLLDWPWISTGICVALAVLIVTRTERSMPQSFRLAPLVASAAPPDEAVAATTDHPVGGSDVYRILFSLLHTAPPWKQFTPLAVYSFVALMGFVLAGGVERFIGAEDLRFLYLPFGSYMLFAGLGVITYNLYRLDPLPVSRRQILMVLTIPGLAFYCGGYALGWWARTTAPQPSPAVLFNVQTAQVQQDLPQGEEARPSNTRTMVWVEVDSSFMGMSWSGEVPTLTTPWGEAHEAWSERLFRGLPPVFYNPYNTTEETSPEFEALMLSRAIQDVYGKTVAPDELRERYFEIENGELIDRKSYRIVERDLVKGSVVGAPIDVFPLLEDYSGLVPPAKGPETPVYLALVLIPWLLLTGWFLGSLRATHSVRRIRWLYWAGLAIPMLAMLTQVALSLFGLFNPEAGRGFLAISIRSLGTGPLAHAVAWAVCLAATGVVYWWTLRRFERAEIPASPISCSMVDWGKDD